jgi:hypothetical protein
VIVCTNIPEARISKNYSATNSGSPEVELRFCPWLIWFKYLTGVGAAKAGRII